jgi:hypothetical protein
MKGGSNVDRRHRGSRVLRIVGGGTAVIAGSFLVLLVPVIVYAVGLAVGARGVPDQRAINAFAAMLSPALMPWVERALTLAVTLWAVRRDSEARPVDGLFTGLVAGVLGVGVTLAFGAVLAIGSAINVVILAALGSLGGFVGQRLRADHSSKRTVIPGRSTSTRPR